jgi:predicted amidohydrolase
VAAAEGPDVALVAEIDLALVAESRAEWPFQADRRPSLYREICEGPR